jgi:hypothetical protein
MLFAGLAMLLLGLVAAVLAGVSAAKGDDDECTPPFGQVPEQRATGDADKLITH